MRINISNATFSSIVGIGQKVKKASKETGEKYLELNRGVNAVVEIDLSQIIPNIDFNSKEFQVYAPNLGLESLRNQILKEYFPQKQKQSIDNIAITPGGMPALDLVIQILDVDTIYFPKFYWGSYSKMATIRKKGFQFYENLEDLLQLDLSNRHCVFISDPNNPTGMKLDDNYVFENIEKLNKLGASIIFDCPYRKLFFRDNFFDRVSDLENVIITESFSKWLGLSGLRLGFIYSNNRQFNDELNIRLLYEFNAVSSASQIIIKEVLSTTAGNVAIENFRRDTITNIQKNIQYLKDRNLLVEEIYENGTPMGIFAIINKTEDFLFKNKIGAVGLDKFTFYDKQKWQDYSRICVSVPHAEFVEFFENIN